MVKLGVFWMLKNYCFQLLCGGVGDSISFGV